MENLFFQKNPLQDLLSSLNAVISTNESTKIITGHVINNPAYTYKFQLKTTLTTTGLYLMNFASLPVCPVCLCPVGTFHANYKEKVS